jgi:hypothetical protein
MIQMLFQNIVKRRKKKLGTAVWEASVWEQRPHAMPMPI